MPVLECKLNVAEGIAQAAARALRVHDLRAASARKARRCCQATLLDRGAGGGCRCRRGGLGRHGGAVGRGRRLHGRR
eukprot:5283315-Alexandrium_andersonii.AAC.1